MAKIPGCPTTSGYIWLFWCNTANFGTMYSPIFFFKVQSSPKNLNMTSYPTFPELNCSNYFVSSQCDHFLACALVSLKEFALFKRPATHRVDRIVGTWEICCVTLSFKEFGGFLDIGTGLQRHSMTLDPSSSVTKKTAFIGIGSKPHKSK